VDRARMKGFLLNDNADNALYLVCELSGDEFLKQQVRRIMGTVVAVAHGWLPPDFMELSINSDVLVTTPLAPVGHLYNAGSRFHYTEIYFKGKRLFETDNVHKITNEEPIDWIQKRLLCGMDVAASAEWLVQLRDTVAPQIRTQLQESSTSTKCNLATELTPAPDMYIRVLNLLRELVATNQWPSTSLARSSVIGNNHDAENQGRAGSFTVVSDEHFDFSEYPLPLGNSLFPELAAAVFDLERSLSHDDNNGVDQVDAHSGVVSLTTTGSSCRAPSSHCAINCNAQFTPHVDSGRGAGQSLSMIVGLGDFWGGGELVVEGTAYDIRYRPLQFDGWKLRHWTKAFSGERFSLVWFTPEGITARKQ
jgi:hypothetical protein